MYASGMGPPGMLRTIGSPGSIRAISAKKQAAWPCRLVELRFCGVYLPAGLILSLPLHSGWIVSKDTGVGERVCTFYTSADLDGPSPLAPLTVHLGNGKVRQNQDGTYLIHGRAWDGGHLGEWPQAWLCGPGTEVLTAAIRGMSAWLRERYTGQWR